MTPHLLTLKATAQLTPNQKFYQLSKPEIEFHVMEEMYAALCMCKKDDICWQRQLNHSGVGEELHLEECTQPELIQPFVLVYLIKCLL